MYQLNIRRRKSVIKVEVSEVTQSTEIEYLKLLGGVNFTWKNTRRGAETNWIDGEQMEIVPCK